MTAVLELKGITKRFPGVLANDNINLTLEQGEIHALLGENGAGKSTLMNILYGLYQPDEGEIYIHENIQKIYSPIDSIKAGVGMVHQHFMLIPVFTVTENIMLGDEDVRGGVFLDRSNAAKRIREISEKYKLEVDPDAYVRDLPVGVQQRVEIIKLLYRKADILIFDEPTAVLTPQEADELFEIMRNLVEQGKSIIFITHKLREVLEVADRITVLRGGKIVGTTKAKEADQKTLASMMVGREVMLHLDKKKAKPSNVVLGVEDLSILDERDRLAVDQVSFEVREGEILGIAGVQGNGQTELVETITGLRKANSGRFRILDKDFNFTPDIFSLNKSPISVRIWLYSLLLGALGIILWIYTYGVMKIRWDIAVTLSRLLGLGGILGIFALIGEAIKRPQEVKNWFVEVFRNIQQKVIGYFKPSIQRQITELGSAHIPEDRQRDGLVLTFPVTDNLALNTYYFEPNAQGAIIQEEVLEASAEDLIGKFDIRTPSADTLVGSLSGGNQQKVIVAREFSRPIKLMVASQPTRGLDVGSIEYIHNRLVEKRDEGTAVLLVSPELDEIMELSDRIAVMYRGRIVDIFSASDVTKEMVGLLMAGINPNDARELTDRS